MVRSNLVTQGDECLRRGVNQATQTINGMNILSWMQGILQNIPLETSFLLNLKLTLNFLHCSRKGHNPFLIVGYQSSTIAFRKRHSLLKSNLYVSLQRNNRRFPLRIIPFRVYFKRKKNANWCFISIPTLLP